MDAFDDVLAANEAFAGRHRPTGRSGWAERRLAVLTCIDSRIDPLALLGLAPGDAKILRNAGARVTDDVLRSLILATHLLGVARVAVIQHSDCQMAKASQAELASLISQAAGVDASGWDYLSFRDHEATLAADLERIRACSLLAPGVVAAGFILDINTGRLTSIGDAGH